MRRKDREITDIEEIRDIKCLLHFSEFQPHISTSSPNKKVILYYYFNTILLFLLLFVNIFFCTDSIVQLPNSC